MGLLPGQGSAPTAPAAGAAPARRVAETERGMLVERAQAGDRDAFEALLERWLLRSLRAAFVILGNEADARDATQEAFLQAWRDIPRLRDPDRFDAWLNRILVNRCRTLLGNRRRTTVREIHMSVLPESDEPASGEGPLGEGGSLSLDAVEHAFRRLSAAERTILVLHHLQQLPLTDVAAGLGIPVGTAKSRLFAARKSLERALEAELR